MSTLALFDLDNTLLPLDSDNEWGRYMVRRGVVDAASYEARNEEFFQQYQTGTLDPTQYLEFVLGTLAQFSREELDALHRDFMRDVIDAAILPQAQALLQAHRDAGDLIAIVTATNGFVTTPIARALDVQHLLAAKPEYATDGRLTGALVGVPTYGAGKVTHARAWLADMGKSIEDFDRSYFYSDSHNDLPLLSIVTHPVAVNPNTPLTAYAKARGWPILKLFND